MYCRVVVIPVQSHQRAVKGDTAPFLKLQFLLILWYLITTNMLLQNFSDTLKHIYKLKVVEERLANYLSAFCWSVYDLCTIVRSVYKVVFP